MSVKKYQINFSLQIQKKYINVSKKFNEILGWNIIKDFNKCQD